MGTVLGNCLASVRVAVASCPVGLVGVSGRFFRSLGVVGGCVDSAGVAENSVDPLGAV